MPSYPTTYLHGDRTPFAAAPAPVRELLTDLLGGPVTGIEDKVGGMSVGVAAVVHGPARSVFVKALDGTQNPRGHVMYRREAATARRLPELSGVPALLVDADLATPDGQWAVNVYQAVTGHPIRHPWSATDLTDVLDAWHRITPALHSCPWEVSAELSVFLGRWRAVLDDPEDPWQPLLLPWADRLTAMTDAVDGTPEHPAVVSHIDLRADNILRADDGTIWFADWAHPSLAAPWADPAILLADVVASGADRADGGEVDVPAVWRSHPATAAFDPVLFEALVVALGAALHWGAQRPPLELLPHQRDWEQAVAEGILPFVLRHR